MGRRILEVLTDTSPKKKAKIEAPLPDNIRCGSIITDISKKQWRLGKSIGSGAFGNIYLVSDQLKEPVKANAEYIAKFEPHDSGPLFVEMNCYLRAARLNMIQEWLDKKNILDIGVPHYIASGSHSTVSEHYRFLILPRYGKDLDNIFKAKNKCFNLKTVLTVSIQILDILEYFHNKGYVHSDIKGSNLLLGIEQKMQKSQTINFASKSKNIKSNRICATCNKKYSNHSESTTHEFIFKRQQSSNQVYLLDYGLANRFLTANNEHKRFCADQRKAHAGTVQFCSRDAHNGCTARRSDLENLGYNILYWLAGKLPWDNISDPNEINLCKCEAMQNLDKFLTNVLGESYPKCIYEYMKYIKKLAFHQQPDYDYCKKLFSKCLLDYGIKNDNCFDFDRLINCDNIKKSTTKVRKLSENLPKRKQIHIISQPTKLLYDRRPLGINSQVIIGRATRSTEKTRELRKEKFNWAKILSSDPENLFRQLNKKSNCDKENVHSRARKTTESSDSNELNVLSIDLQSLNPTYAMIDVINRAQERYNSLNNNSNSKIKSPQYNSENKGYTAAMEYVLSRKLLREREEAEATKRIVQQLKKQNCKSRATRSSKAKHSTIETTVHLLNKNSKVEMKKTGRCINRRNYSLRG